MTQINLDYVLKTAEGEDIKRGEVPFTARQAIREGLLADVAGKPTPPEEMIQCDDLQNKLRSGNPELTPEELVLAKKWCGLAWNKLIYPQCVKVIEGKVL